MSEETKRGRGRPKTVNSSCRLDVSITPEDRKMLEELALKMGESKSHVVRTAIELFYGMRKDSF